MEQPVYDTPDFSTTGHICVCGSTESGKSYFIKWILANLKGSKIMMGDTQPLARSGLPISRIHIFTTNPSQWVGYGTVHDDWGDIEEIYLDNKKYQDELLKKGAIDPSNQVYTVIVFDDFSRRINMNQDKTYQGVYAYKRHEGIKAITTAHGYKDTGALNRKQFKHWCFATIGDEEYRRNIAEDLLGDKVQRVKKWFEAATKPYSFFVINTKTRATMFCVASSGSSSSLARGGSDDESPPDVFGARVGNSGACVGNSGACVGNSGACVGNSGACVGNSGTNINTANKNVHVSGGNYMDNSRAMYQFTQQFDIQQRINNHLMDQRIDFSNHYHQQNLASIKEEAQLIEMLLCSHRLPNEEFNKMLRLLSKHTGKPASIQNYRELGQKYMDIKHTGSTVQRIEAPSGIIDTVGSVLTSDNPTKEILNKGFIGAVSLYKTFTNDYLHALNLLRLAGSEKKPRLSPQEKRIILDTINRDLNPETDYSMAEWRQAVLDFTHKHDKKLYEDLL